MTQVAAVTEMTKYGEAYLERVMVMLMQAMEAQGVAAPKASESYDPQHEMFRFSLSGVAADGTTAHASHMVQADLLCATAPVNPVVAVKSRL